MLRELAPGWVDLTGMKVLLAEKKTSGLPLREVAEFVTALLRRKLPGRMWYHDYQHTLNVVEAISEIGEGENLSREKIDLLCIAGWMHDTGFCRAYLGHEEESKHLAIDFLRSIDFPEAHLRTVLGCIDATKYPQSPKNDLERIVCDADLSHLSKPYYFERADLLRREWVIYGNKAYSDREWWQTNLDFFNCHSYFTEYGQRVMAVGKAENRQKIEEILSGLA